ncbi:hypothetical protein [Streptomyces sennicomposti]
MELHITARDILAGDVFTLHDHEREAADTTWPTALRGHVVIRFTDGGDAVVPADRPITVTRKKHTGPGHVPMWHDSTARDAGAPSDYCLCEDA